MEVILTKDLKNKGRLGDRVQVKLGYAMNFLFPRGLALPLSAENLRRFEDIKKSELKRLAKEKAGSEEIAKKIDGLNLSVSKKTHDGKLYGAVATNDIVKLIAEKSGITVNRDAVNLPKAIKVAGKFAIAIELHPEVTATVNLVVVGEGEIEEPTSYEEALEKEKAAPQAAA